MPVSQRPDAGALAIVVPFAAPHAPSTTGVLLRLALQAEFLPELPEQDQVQGPLPETAVAVPELHRPTVGALARVAPLAAPHTPLVAATGASQDAVVPLLMPSQLQVQGPLPETAVAVPALQRPLVGALVAATPLAGPHCPGVQTGAGVPS